MNTLYTHSVTQSHSITTSISHCQAAKNIFTRHLLHGVVVTDVSVVAAAATATAVLCCAVVIAFDFWLHDLLALATKQK